MKPLRDCTAVGHSALPSSIINKQWKLCDVINRSVHSVDPVGHWELLENSLMRAAVNRKPVTVRMKCISLVQSKGKQSASL